MRNFKMLTMLCAVLLVLGMVSSASAIPTYYFFNITNNGNTNVGGQLYVEVTASGSQVEFAFFNAGPIGSSITDIYFDDGTLLALSTIVNGAGVNFASPATPGDLPGGNDAVPPFVTTDAFSADSSAPDVMLNGVNPGESVTIYFTLQDTKTYADTIAALANGSLRMGLHVQAIQPLGGSDSYVNLVPEPYTLLLLGLGLVGVAGMRRFRK